MILLEKIIIHGTQEKYIELYQGDLTSLEPEEAVDLLIVSAFPNDYVPTPSSLVGALYRKGLSVEELAMAKEQDLRQHFSCWLSKKFTPPDPGLRFSRILCFEPLVRGNPPEVVGDIFRSLAPILGDINEVSDIAMPLVAAGDQGFSTSEILTPLLDAAIHWMESGLPLNRLKIVVYSDHKTNEAIPVFSAAKARYEASTPFAKAEFEYDVFISYAHEDANHAELVIEELDRCRPKIRIFIDRKDINIGSAWQPQIFETLDNCRKVLVLFSPQYLNSKVCKEEFNIAWVRSRENDEEILFPIYLYSAKLPTYMRYRNYIDCREGDEGKLRAACKSLISNLEN